MLGTASRQQTSLLDIRLQHRSASLGINTGALQHGFTSVCTIKEDLVIDGTEYPFVQGRQSSTERLIKFHSRSFSRHEKLNCSLDLQP